MLTLLTDLSRFLHHPEPTEKPRCVLWPSRLIEITADSSKVNSWVYVLGLKPAAVGDPVCSPEFSTLYSSSGQII